MNALCFFLTFMVAIAFCSPRSFGEWLGELRYAYDEKLANLKRVEDPANADQ